MVLQRGPFVVVITSVGQVPGRPANSSNILSVRGLAPRFAGKALSNIYNPKVCGVSVPSRGALAVHCCCCYCRWCSFQLEAPGCCCEPTANTHTMCPLCCATSVSCLQDQLQVSKGGVGMLRLSPDGKPQVFYAGNIVEPMSLTIPPLVSSARASARHCCWRSTRGCL
jgi:hypothetical protein